MGKRKTKKKQNNLPLFIAIVCGFTLYFLSMVWVKNECLISVQSLDQQHNELEDHRNERDLLISQVRQLSSNQRITKIAIDRFGMYQPQPESLVVVVEQGR